MVRGSCLCRGVSWEIAGRLSQMSHCHCSRCRREHGSAFATYAGTREEGLRWTRGKDLVATFQSSPTVTRVFCSVCGSVVPERFGSEQVSVPAGCLDDDPGCRPGAHIFAASKASWYEIPNDGLPRYPAYPPGIPTPEVAPRQETPAPTRPDVLRGGCLCGGVAYEAGPARAMIHCHCSRCRKARAAAHGTNVFADPAGFRYTRGEELLRRYKVPEAARFGTVFCGRCGGSLPGAPGASPNVVIPAGSLDDDPGPVPQIHVFVQDKAPWFEIHDAHPRCEGYMAGYASAHEWVAHLERT
ncbi:MAG TPA: GFA family protein [Thermoanaerobaculia bacterium]|nr:GFA family protein [Thermoanaerobaculia bacterium]